MEADKQGNNVQALQQRNKSCEPRPGFFRFQSDEQFQRISKQVDEIFELIYEAEGWEMEEQSREDTERVYNEVKIKAWENREKKRKAYRQPEISRKANGCLEGLALWFKHFMGA